MPDKDKAGTKHYDPEKHVTTETPGDPSEAGNGVQDEPESPGVAHSDDDCEHDYGVDTESEESGDDGDDGDDEDDDDDQKDEDCDSSDKDWDEDA